MRGTFSPVERLIADDIEAKANLPINSLAESLSTGGVHSVAVLGAWPGRTHASTDCELFSFTGENFTDCLRKVAREFNVALPELADDIAEAAE